MTVDLDSRLADLRRTPQPDAVDVSTLRRRAQHRTRRRRAVVGTATVLAVIAGVVGILALDRDDTERLETVPVDRPTGDGGSADPDATPDEPGPLRRMGDVEGVTVVVSPRTDLADGALVEVRVGGLDRLQEAVIAVCAGDVDADNAATSCDTGAVQRPDADVNSQVAAEAEQTISLARVIQIARHPTDPNQNVSYDCATQPAGCAIAVAPYQLPVQGIVVPVSFRDDPISPPQLSLTPATDLADGEVVTVEAEGVRPNGGFLVQQCTADGTCDDLAWPEARSDGAGVLRTTIAVRAALYTYDGRIDCTATDCTILLRTPGGTTVAEAPLTFGAGAEAPVPRLTIEPPGPYVGGQEVEVRGTGFPPGVDLGSQLGQCPVGLDTAVEERCAYPSAFAPVVVAPDGTFSTTIRLTDVLMFTGTCVTGPGCVIGWVIPHGPTVATAPLTFVP